jgi:starch phosphorylase
MEASGTGNMKFALNGALTIGTMDGANIEIHDRVGSDNIFIFGLTTPEVEARRREGWRGAQAIDQSRRLKEALDQVAGGVFSHDDPTRYRDLVNSLREHDHFMVTADFDSYYAAHRRVGDRWLDRAAWGRSAILNTANVGWFSSDRTIGEYAEEIWRVPVQR